MKGPIKEIPADMQDLRKFSRVMLWPYFGQVPSQSFVVFDYLKRGTFFHLGLN